MNLFIKPTAHDIILELFPHYRFKHDIILELSTHYRFKHDIILELSHTTDLNSNIPDSHWAKSVDGVLEQLSAS